MYIVYDTVFSHKSSVLLQRNKTDNEPIKCKIQEKGQLSESKLLRYGQSLGLCRFRAWLVQCTWVGIVGRRRFRCNFLTFFDRGLPKLKGGWAQGYIRGN
jgi:hypothetical protein